MPSIWEMREMLLWHSHNGRGARERKPAPLRTASLRTAQSLLEQSPSSCPALAKQGAEQGGCKVPWKYKMASNFPSMRSRVPGWSKGCKPPMGAVRRWSLKSVSIKLCVSRGWLGTRIPCQEQQSGGSGEQGPKGSSQPSGLCPPAQQKQGGASWQLCWWLNRQLCSSSHEVCKVSSGLGKQMLCSGIMAPFRFHLPELQDRKIIQIMHFITELSNLLPVVLVVPLEWSRDFWDLLARPKEYSSIACQWNRISWDFLTLLKPLEEL